MIINFLTALSVSNQLLTNPTTVHNVMLTPSKQLSISVEQLPLPTSKALLVEPTFSEAG